MKDVTELFQLWIACSNSLWRQWFSCRANGADDYAEIEQVLFCVLVLRPLNQAVTNLPLQAILSQIRVQYVNDVQEQRQVCSMQKAGNIFCKTEPVALTQGIDYMIRDVDTMGTMMNSEPYVEVIVKKGFVLESPNNVRFLLSDSL
jgi:hypothetical protein